MRNAALLFLAMCCSCPCAPWRSNALVPLSRKERSRHGILPVGLLPSSHDVTAVGSVENDPSPQHVGVQGDPTPNDAEIFSSTPKRQNLQRSDHHFTQSVVLLNVVAVLWGSQHAIIKAVVDDSDPATFSLLRFGVAALLASPYLPGLSAMLQRRGDKNVESPVGATTNDATTTTTWRWGAEMGFWMFLGYSFQAIGLGSTTAQRSGFLLYLNVKFVPFLARLLLGRKIGTPTWLSALVAFSGTALLALGPDQALDLNVGDLWSIAAAAASAMFILRLERASASVPDAAGLNAACLWVVAALAALWALLQPDTASPSTTWSDLVTIASSHPLEIAYLGGVTTTLANWIQSKAQQDVSAERASVIYAMDPVYGALFSYWLLGETLNGVQGWVGAGLITVAAATNAFVDLSSSTTPQIEQKAPEDAISKEKGA
jgi:drug/metabolite transporter (DMT)-like permease